MVSGTLAGGHGHPKWFVGIAAGLPPKVPGELHALLAKATAPRVRLLDDLVVSMKSLLFSAAAILHAASVFAADAPAFTPPPLGEMKAEQVPGLNLILTAGQQSDARAVRLAALFVPAGQPASPFILAGPFTARFEGSIQSP